MKWFSHNKNSKIQSPESNQTIRAACPTHGEIIEFTKKINFLLIIFPDNEDNNFYRFQCPGGVSDAQSEHVVECKASKRITNFLLSTNIEVRLVDTSLPANHPIIAGADTSLGVLTEDNLIDLGLTELDDFNKIIIDELLK